MLASSHLEKLFPLLPIRRPPPHQALLFIELPRLAEQRLAIATEMAALLLSSRGNHGDMLNQARIRIGTKGHTVGMQAEEGTGCEQGGHVKRGCREEVRVRQDERSALRWDVQVVRRVTTTTGGVGSEAEVRNEVPL